MDFDQAKLDEFVVKVVNDLDATLNSALVFIGDKLGLWRLTSIELAERKRTNERYVREWLAAQASSGYVLYDPNTNQYTLPMEHALVLADETSPAYLLGVFQHFISSIKTESKITDAFRTGGGLDWSKHDYDFFEGLERFSRPNYETYLVNNWIPALDNGKVEERLKKGAKVADVGCGYGTSTIIMAKAFPNSTFFGFDYHQPSIDKASQNAAKEGIVDRVKFDVKSATEFGRPAVFLPGINVHNRNHI